VRYNVIYGAMGGVMFLLLWIYLTGVLILGGACWCAAASRHETHGDADSVLSDK
jgi:uncharacterized BrkB/YihY/UPF0761 family membrane protein